MKAVVREVSEKILTNTGYYGRIIIKLDVVDGNIAKKIEINNQNFIIDCNIL